MCYRCVSVSVIMRAVTIYTLFSLPGLNIAAHVYKEGLLVLYFSNYAFHINAFSINY